MKQSESLERKVGLAAMVALVYCIVAGGPFGLEDIVRDAGYGKAILILIITPLVWSLPTALMVSELGSAIPRAGGFYAWVQRGMGNFWGFQESWLTFAGSIFDMALYPTFFVAYLTDRWPVLKIGYTPVILGMTMIAGGVIWNLFGAKAVGKGSIWITLAVLVPFGVIVWYGFTHTVPAGKIIFQPTKIDWLAGVMIAMWNYMGWDNVSTIAAEVKNPKRTYPLAMFIAVSIVSLTYIIPIAAVAHTKISAANWDTGYWVDIGRILGGKWLATAVMLSGAAAAVGTFNALVLSLPQLPAVMAEDKFLPKIFAYRNKSGAPIVAIITCTVAWSACLSLGFEGLVMLDVLLTGLSILLEFGALIALKIKEPDLVRPFAVPGGLAGSIIITIPPVALLVLAAIRNHAEKVGDINTLFIGMFLIALGPLIYLLSNHFRKKSAS